MESIYCETLPKSGILWVQKWDYYMSNTLEKVRTWGMAGVFTALSLGLVANSNKAYAKLPASDIELFADDGGKDDPAPKKNAPDNDKIKINGVDTRGQSMSLEDVEDNAMALSHKYLVVYVNVAKGDVEYENLIKDAVRQNVKEGRDNIYVVFAEENTGQASMAVLSKGTLSLPLIKGRGHDEAAFIKRVYTEDAWAVNTKTEYSQLTAGN